MRIERIEFEAIGPFAEKFDIDLNPLGDSALFLIDGPTGAGKSTILDAITFAIYGDTSGSESDKSRMRSQFAKPTQESWVQLTFSTPNGTYRIRRSPEFQKTKTRGEGTTKVNGTAQFQKLDGSNQWVTEFEQIKDSSEAALKAVGLTKTQFSQTVLLPQGEFDTFLKSDSKDRQELLSKIFNTGRFTKFRDNLKERAKAVDAEIAALSIDVVQKASTIETIFVMFEDESDELKELAKEQTKTKELFEFIESFEEDSKDRLIQARVDLEVADAAFSKANQDLELRKKELEAQNALEKATNEAKASKADLEAKVKEATSLAKDHKFDLVVKESWQARSNKVAANLASLQELLEEEEDLESRQAEAEERTENLEGGRQMLKTYEDLAISLPKESVKLEDEKKKLEPLANKLEKLQSDFEALADTEEAIQALEKLNAELPKAKTLSIELAEKALKAEDLRHGLVAARLANMAGELAEQLKAGEPCGVCGSLDHPNPTKLSKKAITQEEIDKAEADAKTQSKKASAAKEALTKLTTEIGANTKNLKVKPEEFEAKYAKATADLEKSEEANERIATIDKDLVNLKEKIEKNRDLKERAATSVATQTSELDTLNKSIASTTKKIAAKASPYKSIAEKFEATEELAQAISAVVEAEGKANEKTAVIKEREVDFKKLAKSPEFAKTEEALTAVEETKPEYERLLKEVDGFEKSLKAFTPAYKKLQDAVAARAKLSSGSEQIKNLAKLADGYNPLRQPIDTFVLQAMFRQVLEAGNKRFLNLLEGRYTFELDEVGSGGNAKQGLGLSVLDRNTGEKRGTKTLSGGEAFCASLSLALGLSDIVRAESGGLAIDTFFIDEGFGSLDGERLNQVNNMLSRLQAEGRTIGLISHVPEMKEAIQEKIDVQPSKNEGPSKLTVNWMSVGTSA